MSFVRDWADHVGGGPSPEVDDRLRNPAEYDEVRVGDCLRLPEGTELFVMRVYNEDGSGVPMYRTRHGHRRYWSDPREYIYVGGPRFAPRLREMGYVLIATGLAEPPEDRL